MTTPEKELNLRQCHPDFQTFLDHNESESERVRNGYTCHLNQAYGKEQLQTIDVFPSLKANSPILVFIHGGYWRGLDKKSYSFVAEPFVQQNITVCVINYRLIPSVDMYTLTQDVQQAVKWIQNEATRFNGNANQLVLSGHSAGGHLAILTYLMNAALRPSIKAICSLSGLFDLEPIRNSYLNKVLQLSEQDVEKFSVVNKDLSCITCPTLLTVGLDETQLFVEESKKLYEQHRTDAPLTYMGYDGLNHYQIVHKLGQQDNPITNFILEHIY